MNIVHSLKNHYWIEVKGTTLCTWAVKACLEETPKRASKGPWSILVLRASLCLSNTQSQKFPIANKSKTYRWLEGECLQWLFLSGKKLINWALVNWGIGHWLSGF